MLNKKFTQIECADGGKLDYNIWQGGDIYHKLKSYEVGRSANYLIFLSNKMFFTEHLCWKDVDIQPIFFLQNWPHPFPFNIRLLQYLNHI